MALLFLIIISFLPGEGMSSGELAMGEAKKVILYVVFLSMDIVPTIAMIVVHLSFTLFFTHTLVYKDNTNTGYDLHVKLVAIFTCLMVTVQFHATVNMLSKLFDEA